jgi:hypothetical protein
MTVALKRIKTGVNIVSYQDFKIVYLLVEAAGAQKLDVVGIATVMTEVGRDCAP